MERYERNQELRRAREAILEAWRTLLEKPDEMLRDLLAEKVETECGTKPELDDVETFLKERLRTSEPVPEPRPPSDPKPPVLGSRSKIIGFIYREDHVETRTAIGALVEILNRFHRENSEFMDRFASVTVSRKRKLISRNREELYDNDRLIATASINLGNGWWLGRNIGTMVIRKHIETACHVAGVKYGIHLRLIER